MFPLIPITPDPVLVHVGPVSIGWYGLGYVAGLAVLLLVTQREAERRGISRAHVMSSFLLIAALALIGGRLYHVIDQWAIYSQDPLRIVLPPYAGLGLYGGIAGAALGIAIYTRAKKLPWRLALDAVIPGALFAQGIARWGNFFNQELYGPPTTAPWGIAIDCAHRVAEWPCSLFPLETTGFHPLFFYESSLDIAGGFIALYVSRRYLRRLQPGDVAAFWAIWYGLVRSGLEFFREGWNWTLGGIATAQVIGVTLAIIGTAWIIWNHRPGTRPYDYPEPAQIPSPGRGDQLPTAELDGGD